MPKSRSPTPSVQPRDAATLIVVRRGRRGLACLMGRRREDARFLPGCFVFPGGAVESADRTARARVAARSRASRGHGGRGERRRRDRPGDRGGARDLGGDRGHDRRARRRRPRTGATFDEMRRRGVAPALGRLVYLGRAITPARHPIRFHARFFLTFAGHGRDGLHGDDFALTAPETVASAAAILAATASAVVLAAAVSAVTIRAETASGGSPGSDGTGGDSFGGGGSGGNGSGGNGFGDGSPGR